MTRTPFPTARKGLLAALLALAVGGLAFALLRPSSHAAAAPSSPRAAMAVTLATARQEAWPLALEASGALAAWQEAVIGAETGGLRITALHADVGARVRRGQLLAELARDGVAADLRKAEAAVASARASLRQATANAARAGSVRGSGGVSEQQIDDYEGAEQTARAALDSALAALEAQRITLGQTRILAVDDGVITTRSAALGQVLSVGAEVFRLLRQGRVEWRAELDAQQLMQVRSGQPATLVLPGGRTLAGQVRIAAPTLAGDTGRGTVYVSLPPGSAAQAGMFASGRIQVGEQPALTLPQAAVVLRDGRAYVFEPGADNKVVRRSVSTGRRLGERVEIREGLAAGAKVVASGGAFLSDGDTVAVGAAAAAAGTGTTP